jgi:DMSO/TMAO reductase YedYZ molybdopterin-dependent catalytic subunit
MGRVSANVEWELRLSNIANTTVNYSYDQLLTMPETAVSADLRCYGNLVTSGEWSGVSLSYLLQKAGSDPTVASISFFAQDGYKVSLPLEEAIQSDVIIAYQLDGSPLPETLRLVLPEENGNMWISMITSITMSTSTVQSGSGEGSGTTSYINSNWQSFTQRQETIQTQNTTQIKETNTGPAVTPTNPTLPAQTASVQQKSNPEGLSFPVVVVYGIALGATVALVIATIALIRRRNIRETSSSPQPVFVNLNI